MAEAAATQRRAYPLASYNFRVSIGGATIGCTDVSGLSVGGETVVYRHGMSAFEGEELVRFFPGKYIPVTLKRGMMIGATSLLDWLNGSGEPQPMEVSLCDAAGLPAITWRIAKAVAVKLDAPPLNASSGEMAIETLQIMAAGIRLDHVG